MKVGIAQVNPTVGDLSGNLNILLSAYNELVGKGAELVVFPELALCGYPPRDLLLKKTSVSIVCECSKNLLLKRAPVPL